MSCLRSASLALLLSGVDALRVPPTRARPRMTETALKLSIEEAASVFGRLADAQHVYKEPIRTAASGFEFSRRATALPSHTGRSLLPLAYCMRELLPLTYASHAPPTANSPASHPPLTCLSPTCLSPSTTPPTASHRLSPTASACLSPTCLSPPPLTTAPLHHRLAPTSPPPPLTCLTPPSRSNTAIKPKWLIAYTEREPCGEDVSLPPHRTQWSVLLFADSSTCTREHFRTQLSGAEYPLAG